MTEQEMAAHEARLVELERRAWASALRIMDLARQARVQS